MVSEEFIRHAESHLQVLLPGNIDFRADSSPSPPTTQQQQPPAELVGCVTQSREEVKTWVCSNLNAGVLLHSCSGFDTWALGRRYFLDPRIQVAEAVQQGTQIHDSFAALSLLIIFRCRHAMLFRVHWPHRNSGMLILQTIDALPDSGFKLGLRWVRAGAATLNQPKAQGNQFRALVQCTTLRLRWPPTTRKHLVLRQDFANYFNYHNYIDSHKFPVIAGQTRIDNKAESFNCLPELYWPMPRWNHEWQWSSGPLQAIALACFSWFPNAWPLDLLRLWAK